MDPNEIKSQIGGVKLPETSPRERGDKTESVGTVEMGAGKRNQLSASLPLPVSAESVSKAEREIQSSIEKMGRGKMTETKGGQSGGGTVERSAREVERMGAMREGMVQSSAEPSMRERQEQVPRRVDQGGNPTQRPRLSQRRAPTQQSGGSGASSSVLKLLALPLGSGAAAGIIAWWLN